MVVVLDASILLAWLFDDESSDVAEGAIAHALAEGAVAPSILWYEVANGLRSAVSSRRLAQEEVESVHQRVNTLGIQSVELGIPVLVNEVSALALAHNLTTYDASYLHLALRERLPLATSDRRLRAAAEAAGCAVFS